MTGALVRVAITAAFCMIAWFGHRLEQRRLQRQREVGLR